MGHKLTVLNNVDPHGAAYLKANFRQGRERTGRGDASSRRLKPQELYS